jgi:PAS domain S-box-containing protein
MKSAPKPSNEQQRLQALQDLKILDTLPEKDFDDLTLIASQICETPIALVSLVDESRQWFKSKQGLEASETPREVAFCAHAILGDEVFTVSDSSKDERFFDNPLVTGGPKVAFYAGAPLLSPDGFQIGTLCVIDNKPKVLTDEQRASLKALSGQISRLLDLRVQLAAKNTYVEKLEYKKAAVENLSEGVVLQDAEFRIIEFNAAALNILGLTAEQLTGKTSMDPDWNAIKEDGTEFPGTEHPAVLALTAGQKQKGVVMGVRRLNFETRWIEINSTPVFTFGKTKPTFSVTSFRDITQEKNAKQTIQRNEANLKRVIDGVPALIGHWDRNLNNLNANIAYTEYFGKTPEQIKGMPIQDLLGEELFKQNYPFMEKALMGVTQTFERDFRTPGGGIRHTLSSYLPEFSGKEVIAFFVIVTDVTELKRLENERQRLSAKMIESSKLSTLGEMAGGVAHEINTPLAIINTKISLLLNAYLTGATVDSNLITQLQKIKLTSERIEKIVKGLRQFSRNSETDPFEPVTVLAVVEATLDLCQERLVQSQIVLDKNIDAAIQVSGKFTELSQVLMNLIGNSIDAIVSRPEKWIKIDCFQEADRCILQVSDSGNGIPDKIVEKIMNPFFSTKEIGKGTGLGLSISSGIISAHGGKFWYDKKSQNTRFVIDLPILQTKSQGKAG